MAAATIHIDRLLETCIKKGASDLHLHVGKQPTLRLHGRLRPLDTKVLEPEDTIALMKAITPERAQQELQEQGGTDFGFEFAKSGRFRTSVYSERGNVSIVLRLIPTKLLSFDEIGLPEIVRSLCRRPRGMFLVTGPNGSGKTTTLATMIDYINMNFDKHVITIEDPIEYYHPHKKSMLSQREVGNDVPSFSEALKRALRMDPDVIMVGELRDLETIEAALRAAETGHLVFGTLHTTSAQGTVTRIVDQFPVDQQEQIRVQLSSSLIAVLCQAPVGRSGHGRGLRVHGGDQRRGQPHPREQGVPDSLLHPDGQEAGHAAPGRAPLEALQGRQDQRRGHDGPCPEPQRDAGEDRGVPGRRPRGVGPGPAAGR